MASNLDALRRPGMGRKRVCAACEAGTMGWDSMGVSGGAEPHQQAACRSLANGTHNTEYNWKY
jgi:hypothetical protein